MVYILASRHGTHLTLPFAKSASGNPEVRVKSIIMFDKYRGHTNPPHPHTSDLINLNDLNCSEESSVLRAFSELLHLINSNLN